MRDQAEQDYVEYVSGRLLSLRQLAYLLCGDEHRADDLVQQTITKLYIRWGKLGAVEHLDAYVRTMLVRTFLDEKRRPWTRVNLVPDPPDNARAAEHGVEDAMVLRAALAKVPKRQQAVLVLRFLCDMSVEACASALGCSTGTVKSQSARGLVTLRRLLEGQLTSSLGRAA